MSNLKFFKGRISNLCDFTCYDCGNIYCIGRPCGTSFLRALPGLGVDSTGGGLTTNLLLD